MCLNSRRLRSLFGILFMSLSFSFAQESETEEEQDNMPYVQIFTSSIFPNALGSNFLSEAYIVKQGFMGDILILFDNRLYVGLQGIYNNADVENTALVGQFGRSKIRHHYVQGGYSFLPRAKKLGLTAGLGIGYARYKNRKGSTKFFDDGFSIMTNARLSYRLSPEVGLQSGIQFSNDFMNTDVAPELESFFKNAQTLYFSVGLAFYIGD